MPLPNRNSGLERGDLRLTELRFHIYSKENNVRKLLKQFEGDPTVGSKVMPLLNQNSGMERRDQHLTE